MCYADGFGNDKGAVDVGGSQREFLQLLIRAVSEHSGIFVGPENRCVLTQNAYGKALSFCQSSIRRP